MNEEEMKKFHTTGTLLRVFGTVELLYAAWLVAGLAIGAVVALQVPIPLYIACVTGSVAEGYLFWNYGTRTADIWETWQDNREHPDTQDGTETSDADSFPAPDISRRDLTKEHQRILLLVVPLVMGVDLLYAALTGSFSLLYMLVQLLLPILALAFEMRTMDGRWKD